MRVDRFGRLSEEPGGMPLEEEMRLAGLNVGQYVICAAGDQEYFGVVNVVRVIKAFNIHEMVAEYERLNPQPRELGWESRFWVWMRDEKGLVEEINDEVVMVHAAYFGEDE